jgi:hypothetical protein
VGGGSIHALLRAANSGDEVAAQHYTDQGIFNAGRGMQRPRGALGKQEQSCAYEHGGKVERAEAKITCKGGNEGDKHVGGGWAVATTHRKEQNEA